MKLTGAQILWEALVREGVTDVFGYPGGAILPAYDAMLQYPIRHILVRHEQGATHMADGYARATGKVGVAIATSGPGATNMVTGIATAMMDSSPIVCITGQVGSGLIGSDAFQETDITGITLPITKHNFLVTHASEVAPAIREAFAIAASGRPGPVLVDITKDAQLGAAEFDWDDAAPDLESLARPGHSMGVDPLALINAAQRPLILAGHGIILGGAGSVLQAFAEKTQIPVAMTLLGIGCFPASHPLTLGMSFDDRVTGNLKTYAPHAKKIHVDIDPAEFNKNVRVDAAISGDVGAVVSSWLSRLADVDRAQWLAHISDLKGDSAVRDIQNLPDDGHLYAAHVINDIWRLTKGEALVVSDVGQHQMWEAQYYKHNRSRSLITSGGLGTMGFALP